MKNSKIALKPYNENDLKSIIKVGAEGLKALEKGRPRKQVAQFLIDAAEKMGDAKNLLRGKRERLFSRPSDQDLIEFVDEAVKQDARKRELEKATTIKTLLGGYANQESVYSGIITTSDEQGTSFYAEILKGLKQRKHT